MFGYSMAPWLVVVHFNDHMGNRFIYNPFFDRDAAIKYYTDTRDSFFNGGFNGDEICLFEFKEGDYILDRRCYPL